MKTEQIRRYPRGTMFAVRYLTGKGRVGDGPDLVKVAHVALTTMPGRVDVTWLDFGTTERLETRGVLATWMDHCEVLSRRVTASWITSLEPKEGN